VVVDTRLYEAGERGRVHYDRKKKGFLGLKAEYHIYWDAVVVPSALSAEVVDIKYSVYIARNDLIL